MAHRDFCTRPTLAAAALTAFAAFATAAPPAQPDPRNVNLVKNIERLKLSVGRILPLHGRVVPVSELYTAAKQPMPR